MPIPSNSTRLYSTLQTQRVHDIAFCSLKLSQLATIKTLLHFNTTAFFVISTRCIEIHVYKIQICFQCAVLMYIKRQSDKLIIPQLQFEKIIYHDVLNK